MLHHDVGVFKGLPNPLTCMRYHSLAIERATPVERLKSPPGPRTARNHSVRQRHWRSRACLHPESIPTERGHDLLANFLKEHARHETPGRPGVRVIEHREIFHDEMVV